jgi:serine/threonine-protein kinase
MAWGVAVTAYYGNAYIVAQRLPGGERKIVQRDAYYGRYLPSGHLVYIHQGTLFAAPFNLERLEITAEPVPVLENLESQIGNGAGEFAFSRTGSFVYQAGNTSGLGVRSIYWMTDNGRTEPLRRTPASYINPRFSPDGTRLVMGILDQQFDIWIYEWARDAIMRLTFDAAVDRYPIWTPDGRRVTFASNRHGGSGNIYWKRADGTGEPQRLTESANQQLPLSWHPTGKFLAFREAKGATQGESDHPACGR